jgi:mono/diheme cytochrome c family protein
MEPRTTIHAALGVAAAAAMLAVPGAAQEVTFARDVAPLLYQNCVECHRPGSFAPMSLMTYDDARRYGRMIRTRVSLRQMPPWHVDQTVGVQQFANDVSLSDEEIQTIVSWVDQGMARGDDRDMPVAPTFGDGRAWQAEGIIGRPPDVIIQSSPYTVPARGQDQWWNPLVKWEPLGEERWMMAYEFKPAYPNGLEVVHHGHASLSFPTDTGMRGGVGIAHYGVGKGYEVFPDGVGMRIPAGEGQVDWNIHYSSISVEHDVPNDVVDIGLWFYPRGETPELATEGEVLFRVDGHNSYDRPMNRANDILIPPNGYQVIQGAHVLEEPALIGSFRPHMHTRGKEMSMEAILPDGRRMMLGKVDDYKHIWQLGYEFEEDAKPLLPKGTVLLFSAVFDNTADNPLNPDPNQWVVFGRRGPDEMVHMWVNITYLSPEQFDEIAARRASTPVAAN